MRVQRIRVAALVLISGIALSGCAYDMYGDPYGYGYGPYGGVAVGYGDYGYGYGGYGGYGYGYPYAGYDNYGGYNPFGWYGDYYYPGVGIYVYDRNRTRHRWNDNQRGYWTNRSTQWRNRSGATVSGENWGGWNRTATSNGGYRNWGGRSATTSGSTRTDRSGDHHWHDRGNDHPR